MSKHTTFIKCQCESTKCKTHGRKTSCNYGATNQVKLSGAGTYLLCDACKETYRKAGYIVGSPVLISLPTGETWNQNPYEIRTESNGYFSTPLDDNCNLPDHVYLDLCIKHGSIDGISPKLVISRKYTGKRS